MKILVTGAAGFIGFHLVKSLLNQTQDVIGLDNINAYYDVQLKLDRLKDTGISSSKLWYNRIIQSSGNDNYQFIQLNVEDKHNIENLFRTQKFDIVVHLAAQAGVRYSIDNPQTYIDSNIIGFHTILECCRQFPVKQLIYASSSSVYGNNIKVPFNEDDNVDHPISLYASTKKSNELMAHTYSHLFNIYTTGLRFFTVYGPWGRPDMAYFKFTDAILKNENIKVFNHGKLSRDFTYIDDIIKGINNVIFDQEYSLKKSYKIFNIGNNQPVELLEFIKIIEQLLGKDAVREYLPMQDGDVEVTFADITKINQIYGFLPETTLKVGLEHFITWYKSYYNV